MAYTTKTILIHLQTIANRLVSKGFATPTTRSHNRGVKYASFTKNDDQIIINEDGYSQSTRAHEGRGLLLVA